MPADMLALPPMPTKSFEISGRKSQASSRSMLSRSGTTKTQTDIKDWSAFRDRRIAVFRLCAILFYLISSKERANFVMLRGKYAEESSSDEESEEGEKPAQEHEANGPNSPHGVTSPLSAKRRARGSLFDSLAQESARNFRATHYAQKARDERDLARGQTQSTTQSTPAPFRTLRKAPARNPNAPSVPLENTQQRSATGPATTTFSSPGPPGSPGPPASAESAIIPSVTHVMPTLCEEAATHEKFGELQKSFLRLAEQVIPKEDLATVALSCGYKWPCLLEMANKLDCDLRMKEREREDFMAVCRTMPLVDSLHHTNDIVHAYFPEDNHRWSQEERQLIALYQGLLEHLRLSVPISHGGSAHRFLHRIDNFMCVLITRDQEALVRSKQAANRVGKGVSEPLDGDDDIPVTRVDQLEMATRDKIKHQWYSRFRLQHTSRRTFYLIALWLGTCVVLGMLAIWVINITTAGSALDDGMNDLHAADAERISASATNYTLQAVRAASFTADTLLLDVDAVKEDPATSVNMAALVTGLLGTFSLFPSIITMSVATPDNAYLAVTATQQRLHIDRHSACVEGSLGCTLGCLMSTQLVGGSAAGQVSLALQCPHNATQRHWYVAGASLPYMGPGRTGASPSNATMGGAPPPPNTASDDAASLERGVWSDLFGAQLVLPSVTYSIPIWDEATQTLVAVLAAEIDLEGLGDNLRSTALFDSGVAFFVDKASLTLVASSRDTNSQDAELVSLQKWQEDTLMSTLTQIDASTGNSGLATWPPGDDDDEGVVIGGSGNQLGLSQDKKKRGVLAYVDVDNKTPPQQWSLVVSTPVADFERDLASNPVASLILGFAALLFAAVLMYASHRSMSKYQTYEKKERALLSLGSSMRPKTRGGFGSKTQHALARLVHRRPSTYAVTSTQQGESQDDLLSSNSNSVSAGSSRKATACVASVGSTTPKPPQQTTKALSPLRSKGTPPGFSRRLQSKKPPTSPTTPPGTLKAVEEGKKAEVDAAVAVHQLQHTQSPESHSRKRSRSSRTRSVDTDDFVTDSGKTMRQNTHTRSASRGGHVTSPSQSFSGSVRGLFKRRNSVYSPSGHDEERERRKNQRAALEREIKLLRENTDWNLTIIKLSLAAITLALILIWLIWTITARRSMNRVADGLENSYERRIFEDLQTYIDTPLQMLMAAQTLWRLKGDLPRPPVELDGSNPGNTNFTIGPAEVPLISLINGFNSFGARYSINRAEVTWANGDVVGVGLATSDGPGPAPPGQNLRVVVVSNSTGGCPYRYDLGQGLAVDMNSAEPLGCENYNATGSVYYSMWSQGPPANQRLDRVGLQYAWSHPWLAPDGLTVSASSPLYDPNNGALAGVLAVDISLENLGIHLIETQRDSVSYIQSTDEKLLASSVAAENINIASHGSQAIDLDHAEDETIVSTVNFVANLGGAARLIGASSGSEVRLKRPLSAPLTAIFEFDLGHLVVTLDFENVRGEFERLALLSLLVCFGTVIIVGYFTLRVFMHHHKKMILELETKSKKKEAETTLLGGDTVAIDALKDKQSKIKDLIMTSCKRKWYHKLAMRGDALRPTSLAELRQHFSEVAVDHITHSTLGRDILAICELESTASEPDASCGDRAAPRVYMTLHSLPYAYYINLVVVLYMGMLLYRPDTADDMRRDGYDTVGLAVEGMCLLLLAVDVVLEFSLRYLSRGSEHSLKTDVLRDHALGIVYLLLMLAQITDYSLVWSKGLSLEYVFPLRQFLIILKNESVLRSMENFVMTLIKARDVMLLYCALVVVAATLGTVLLRNVLLADESSPGTGFNNIVRGLTVMFIFVTTGENFADVVYPSFEVHPLYSAFYIIMLMVGMFFVLGMVIGVFHDGFKQRRKRRVAIKHAFDRTGAVAAFTLLDFDQSQSLERDEFVAFLRYLSPHAAADPRRVEQLFDEMNFHTESDNKDGKDDGEVKEETIDIQEFVLGIEASSWHRMLGARGSPLPGWRLALQVGLDRSIVRNVMLTLVLVQLWLVALYNTLGDDVVLDNVMVGMVFVHLFEIALRILAAGPREFFFYSRANRDSVQANEAQLVEVGNRFESVVVIFSFGTWLVTRVTSLRWELNDDEDWLRFALALPVVRVLSMVRRIRALLFALLSLVPSFLSTLACMVTIIIWYATVGVYAFAEHSKTLQTDSLPNFNNLQNALLTLFQLLVGEGWHEVMYSAIAAAKSFQPAWYFVSYIIIITLLFSNVFIGLVLDRFAERREAKARWDARKRALAEREKARAETLAANIPRKVRHMIDFEGDDDEYDVGPRRKLLHQAGRLEELRLRAEMLREEQQRRTAARLNGEDEEWKEESSMSEGEMEALRKGKKNWWNPTPAPPKQRTLNSDAPLSMSAGSTVELVGRLPTEMVGRTRMRVEPLQPLPMRQPLVHADEGEYSSTASSEQGSDTEPPPSPPADDDDDDDADDDEGGEDDKSEEGEEREDSDDTKPKESVELHSLEEAQALLLQGGDLPVEFAV